MKITNFAKRHKIISGLAIAAIVVIGYYGYGALTNKAGETHYVLGAAQKGTIISSVSGSGQVAVSNQLDIKPKVSGDVVYVAAKNGQTVKSGALLAQLDSTDAQRAVRDAQTSLETAKLDLNKTLAPPDELTLLQAEDSLTQLQESKQKAQDALENAYTDGFNNIATAYFDLPSIMSGLDNLLHGFDINKSQSNVYAYADLVSSDNAKWAQANNYRQIAEDDYTAARTAYDANFAHYKSASVYSDKDTVSSLIDETYDVSRKMAATVKDMDNLISYVVDATTQNGKNVPSITATHQTNIRTYTSKITSISGTLLSSKTDIVNDKNSIVSADRSIAEKQLSLENLKAGADELTLRSKQLAVQQREDALASAKETLSDYYIRAPFDGVVAKVNIKKGDTVSSGTAAITLITTEHITEIPLNEVDIAKIKAGQKATLTFDAIPDLTITGQVAEYDTLGTVSQGVVTYNVKISFDVQDDRIKPGMSLSAAIITDARQNVLTVPNSAVKSSGGSYYVEMPGTLKQQAVEIGLADSVNTEILSGLNEGDEVIVRTISASAAKTGTTGQSILPTGNRGAGAAAGGAARAQFMGR